MFKKSLLLGIDILFTMFSTLVFANDSSNKSTSSCVEEGKDGKDYFVLVKGKDGKDYFIVVEEEGKDGKDYFVLGEDNDI